MKYRGSLQSIHMKPNKLEELDQLLREDSTSPEVKCELEADEFIHEYSTPRDIQSAQLIQNFISDFKIDLCCKERNVTLRAYEHPIMKAQTIQPVTKI